MKPRSMTFDLFDETTPVPVAGDLMIGARAAYRVTEVRPVDSRVWWNRWKITMVNLGTPDDVTRHPPPDGCRIHRFTSYQRGEGPQEFARKNDLPTGPPAKTEGSR